VQVVDHVPDATPAPLFDRRLALAIALICLVECWALHGVRHDDAYITFRYAENLARGLGPVFNPTERILGTTAPGHMLLGALLYGIVGKLALPSAMAVFGCLGWAAQALAVFALLRGAFAWGPSAAISLAVALGAATSYDVVALETNLVAACTLWSIAFAVRRAWLPAAVSCGLAGLLRPDAYLLALLLGCWGLYEARRQLLRPILAFSAITLPWQLTALAYYGSAIPQPAHTKHEATQLLPYLVHEVWEPMSTALPFSPTPVLCGVGWLLVLAGAMAWGKRQRRAWIVALYGAAHFVAYAWLRPFTVHTWHLYPLRLVIVVLVLASFAALYERLPWRAARVAAAALGVLVLGLYAQRTSHFARTQASSFWFGARDGAYLEVARFLRQHARPGDVVGAVEVGTIGYHTELRMYDWGGLITRHPEARPRDPTLRWVVVDDQYRGLAGGMLPARQWDVHGFKVNVYNVEWMGRALQAAMARLPGRSPAEVMTQHRDVVASELAALVRGSGRTPAAP